MNTWSWCTLIANPLLSERVDARTEKKDLEYTEDKWGTSFRLRERCVFLRIQTVSQSGPLGGEHSSWQPPFKRMYHFEFTVAQLPK